MPKKIIYLLGSGATQAVIQDLDLDYSLMTEDIKRFILAKPKLQLESNIQTQLEESPDVEHLISVLECQYNFSVSNRIRSYYRDAIVTLSDQFVGELKPNLYTILCDFHANIPAETSDEELSCFITLNYEDLLERSILTHLQREVNYFLDTTSPVQNPQQSINVLKLHGSFSWKNGIPIQVQKMSSITTGMNLWIPPGVDKRKENYPFNLLWGQASNYLMDCDVVRVVGCSLSRNDWSLIPVLYTAQKFVEGKQIEIEVIDFLTAADNIQKNYPYLDVKRITQLDDLTAFYQRQFPNASPGARDKEMETHFTAPGDARVNPLRQWLDAKIDTLVETKGSDSIDATSAKYVKKFYYKEYAEN